MRRVAAGLIVLLCAVGAGPSLAASPSPYVVTALEVSAEGEDAVAAKETALSAAMVEALARVFDRVAVGVAVKRPDAALADALVSSFSFESERIGPASYGARITVRFDANAVRRHLAGLGARVVDEPAPTVLIVPVLIEDGTPRLWEEAEPWAAAIAAEDPGDRLAPAVLPGNGRGDHDLDPDYLLSLAQVEVVSLRLRYRAHSVLLAVAEAKPGAVRLSLRGEDAAGPVDAKVDVEGGLAEAARQLVATLQGRWKRAATGIFVEQRQTPSGLRGAVEAGRPGDAPRMAISGLSVRVLLRPGDDWPTIRRRLEQSGGVAGVTLEYAEPGLAEVTIWPRTSPTDLSQRLLRHGLDLFQAGDAWLLQAY